MSSRPARAIWALVLKITVPVLCKYRLFSYHYSLHNKTWLFIWQLHCIRCLKSSSSDLKIYMRIYIGYMQILSFSISDLVIPDFGILVGSKGCPIEYIIPYITDALGQPPCPFIFHDKLCCEDEVIHHPNSWWLFLHCEVVFNHKNITKHFFFLKHITQWKKSGVTMEEGRESRSFGLWSMGSQTLLQRSELPSLSRTEIQVIWLPWYLLNPWGKNPDLGHFSTPTPIRGNGKKFWQTTDSFYPYPTATDKPSLAERLFW